MIGDYHLDPIQLRKVPLTAEGVRFLCVEASDEIYPKEYGKRNNCACPREWFAKTWDDCGQKRRLCYVESGEIAVCSSIRRDTADISST